MTKTQSKLNHFKSKSKIKSDSDLMLDLNWHMFSRIATMKLSVTLTVLKANLNTSKSIEKTEWTLCQKWFRTRVFYYFYTQNQHFSDQESHWHMSQSLIIMLKVLQSSYIHQTWLLFNDWSSLNFLCQIFLIWFSVLSQSIITSFQH